MGGPLRDAERRGRAATRRRGRVPPPRHATEAATGAPKPPRALVRVHVLEPRVRRSARRRRGRTSDPKRATCPATRPCTRNASRPGPTAAREPRREADAPTPSPPRRPAWGAIVLRPRRGAGRAPRGSNAAAAASASASVDSEDSASALERGASERWSAADKPPRTHDAIRDARRRGHRGAARGVEGASAEDRGHGAQRVAADASGEVTARRDAERGFSNDTCRRQNFSRRGNRAGRSMVQLSHKLLFPSSPSSCRRFFDRFDLSSPRALLRLVRRVPYRSGSGALRSSPPGGPPLDAAERAPRLPPPPRRKPLPPPRPPPARATFARSSPKRRASRRR